MYPCEECGYRAQDQKDIKEHTEIHHKNPAEESISLEELGIPALTIIMTRKKQQTSLDTSCESDADEYKPDNEELLVEDDYIAPVQPKKVETRRKRKLTDNTLASKEQKIEVTGKPYPCRICNFSFTRAFNIDCHLKSAHGKNT